MKKVTAFIGTQTRRNTYRAVQEFEKNLKQYGEIDFEYLFLSDHKLEFCRGCKLCFDTGEENCPIKDDRDLLLDKMQVSDGVIFATPSYAFQLSARMKNFFDRTAFTNHRPRYFGKTCTALVTQGIFGGGAIVKYLCNAGENMGFHASKGCFINTLEPMTDLQQRKLVQQVKKASTRFYKLLTRPTPTPSILRLLIFRFTRTGIKSADHKYRDYQFFKEKGWFESDYYYEVSLGPVKKLAGNLFDLAARLMTSKR
jgi:multimeric flavodoxin WrbA